LKKKVGELYSIFRSLGRPIEHDSLFFALEEVKKGLLSHPDKRKPSIPASDRPYDLGRITSYWDSLPSNLDLPLEDLRLKAIVLVMIAGLARPSDLARLDLDSLRDTGTDLWLWVWRAKNSGSGYSAPMVLRKLPAGEALHCPVRALKCYLDRTALLRPATPPPESVRPVFIVSHRPFTGLSPDRISVLVRDFLRTLGVDASTYSIRKRATTAALEAGVAPSTVQAGGRWKNIDTMWSHYVRPADPAAAGAAAIQGGR